MFKLAAVFACALSTAALAQSVALQGRLGGKALLVIDGGQPRILAPGESFGGVKVVSVVGETAVVEVAGLQRTLRIGETQSNVGGAGNAPSSGRKIVLSSGSGGHFTTQGRINNQQVQFIVDTGATSVAISEMEAKRLGLAYKDGKPGAAITANGPVTTWSVKLASVRIGDVEVRDVDATVVPAPMPYILLGNSFLSRFQMRRENDMMVLERRY